jgi:hypothetical protein
MTDLASRTGGAPLPARLLTKPFRKFHLAQAVREVLDE